MKRIISIALMTLLALSQIACNAPEPPEPNEPSLSETGYSASVGPTASDSQKKQPTPNAQQSVSTPPRPDTRRSEASSKACESTHRNPIPETPRLSLDTAEVEFGEVFPDKDPEKNLRITNTGGHPLRIEAVKSSCPCVNPTLAVQDIPPNGSADLTIKLALVNYPKNLVKGSVYLLTNDPTQNPVQIPVHADIHPEYVVEPESLDFGTVKRAQTHTATLTLRQNGPREVTLKEVQAPPELTVTFEKADSTTTNAQSGTPDAAMAKGNEAPQQSNDRASIPTHDMVSPQSGTPNPEPARMGTVPSERGNERDDELPARTVPIFTDATYLIHISYTPSPDAHTLNTTLTLITDVPRIPKHPIRVRAKAVGIECAITPKVLVFGPNAPGTDIGVLEITPSGATESLDVTAATCTLDDIQLAIAPPEPGKPRRVHVRLKDTVLPGDKNGKITLTVQDGPLTETRDIAIYGTVK